MDKLTSAASAQIVGTYASAIVPAASFSTVAVAEMRRERALVHAGTVAPGAGELCPQTGGDAADRDISFFRPSSGTAVSGGPPV